MQQYEVASLPLKDIFFLSSLLGLLGAVMDNAITINTAVSEIVATNPSVSYSKLVNSIYEIIYDVMGTMINVLFFAYLSSSLPIIILKLSNGYNLISVFTIDYIFDIVRFLIGSIGIVISLPISGIIADEAAIGMVNQKTTAVRVIPVVGKGVGETVEFGGLLGYAPIMPVNKFDCSAFVNRVGRIPAPIHSFKN